MKENVIENSFTKIKGNLGGRPFKIVNDSKFVKKCEQINRILQFEHND